MLTTKLTEVSEELRRTHVRHEEMTRDYSKVADSNKQAEQEILRLQSALSNADSYRHDTDAHMKAKLDVSH